LKKETNHFSIVTFATNKHAYFNFALNCARSVLLHNKIPIYIITNLNVKIPADLVENVFILKAKPEHAALGIGIKLYTDQYLQTDESLFIDADCLCFGNLFPIFEAAGRESVSVVGTIVDSHEFCGDQQAKTIEENFNLSKLIRFNGGLYYLKKDEVCKKIFELARSIIPNYDKFGFQRINKNTLNEEGLLSIAMMTYRQKPMMDKGIYMTDLSTDHHPFGLNILTGKRKLNNPKKGATKHRPWYPIGNYSPLVLHFGGQSLRTHPYNGQSLLLQLKSKKIPNILSSLISFLIIEIPYFTYYKLCGLLKK